MNINLQIDRLILDGIDLSPSQRRLLQAAVEAELTHLLMTRGLAPSLMTGGAIPSVPADAIQVAPNTPPSQMGQQIAQAIYQGIGV